MTTPVSGLINDLDKVIKTKSSQSLFSHVSKPSTLCSTVWKIANIDHPSFIAELSSVSEFSSLEKANQFCYFLRIVLDKHAPPSLQKDITHNSTPWFESISD